MGNYKLPKKTNEHTILDKYIFKDITDSMDYEQRRKIADKNNYEYTKRQYEKMGIKIIGECDDLFYAVELPEGWEIKTTDHYMWNNVLDDKGRIRISFFRKGASYDRDAFSNFEHRYSFSILPFDEYKSDATFEDRRLKPWSLYITDCRKKIKKITEVTADTEEEYYKIDGRLREEGENFLNQNYPEWKDINCYWD